MQRKAEIFAFFGLIASGKSTLAEAWASQVGASYYNSDKVRKELAGLLPVTGQKESFNKGIYTPEFSKRTYDALLEMGAKDLAAAKTVVLDASYQELKERNRVQEMAEKAAKKLVFVLCECPEDVMRKRMDIRAQDPGAVSDGRWEIYLQQKEKFKHPDELASSQLITINTDKPVKVLIEQLCDLVAER
jgi:predicted kinase